MQPCDLVGADPLMRGLAVYFWLSIACDAKHMSLGVRALSQSPVTSPLPLSSLLFHPFPSISSPFSLFLILQLGIYFINYATHSFCVMLYLGLEITQNLNGSGNFSESCFLASHPGKCRGLTLAGH